MAPIALSNSVTSGPVNADQQQDRLPSLSESSINVLLTGFGPFANVEVNPSWMALQPLRGKELLRDEGRTVVKLHCQEIPVVYEEVLRRVPVMHGIAPSDEANCMASISYDLFVHVGVSPSRTCVCLERRARRFGYEREDFHGENAPSEIHPGSGKLSCGFLGPDWGFDNRGELGTNVDIERIASVVNSAGLAEVNVSNDAGLYLCEYAFFASLACALRAAKTTQSYPKPVIFVHVPNESSDFTLPQLTEILLNMVLQLIDSLHIQRTESSPHEITQSIIRDVE
ncbi:MAG: hypothetical protein CYPHOPRED_000227 [Cyphobasidiales sp. Tagirdzhanova-0007]|nr:MAG: hypothetical protein CYPHOPRED_000227 [Cyphobasidiales sp. Tagirdzhanova-0007]